MLHFLVTRISIEHQLLLLAPKLWPTLVPNLVLRLASMAKSVGMLVPLLSIVDAKSATSQTPCPNVTFSQWISSLKRFHFPLTSPPAFGEAISPNPGSGRGACHNQPAWMTQQHHSRINDSPANPDPAKQPPPQKKPRQCALFVRSCQHQVTLSPVLRPMPIFVDNGLPHLRLKLGLSADATLSVLFDSGADLSSGYLPCHLLWIMRQNPEMVASFERFEDSNPFEPMAVLFAIQTIITSPCMANLLPSSATKCLTSITTAIPSVSHSGPRQ
jgi:hypothetical protein